MPSNNGPSRWLTIRPSEKPQLVEQGIYHYTRDDSGTYTRFHLRVDPDGQGYLLVNATIGARLSPSGALIAKELLDGGAIGQLERLEGFTGNALEVAIHADSGLHHPTDLLLSLGPSR